MSDIFDNNKRKVLFELLEVISKGVELIATEHLDKNLYDAFERYVVSTLKVVDSTFATNYASSFSSNSYALSNNYGIGTLFNPYSNMRYLNSASSVARIRKKEQEVQEYKFKLKYTLQQLVSIIKVLVYA